MHGSIYPDPVTGSKPQAHTLALYLVCLLLAWFASPSAAEVTATIDRSTIGPGDTVELVIETVDEPKYRPDLSVLAADFQILDRRSSRRVSIVGSRRSERHFLMLRLLPRRFGALTIPAISIGDTSTAPLQLSVSQGAAPTAEPAATRDKPADEQPAASNEAALSPAAILEAAIEPSEVYTGQQLILTAKVFLDGPIQRPRLHDPQIPSTEILPLGEDRYQAQRGGRSRQVYERRYALFPHDPGHLKIRPLLFEGWTPDAVGGPPGRGYTTGSQPVRARSRALTAEVLPAPDGADADHWLPARSLTLSESGPEPYRARVGQPIERRISLRADGIMARDLPALAAQAPHQIISQERPPRLRDDRRPEGVVGTREEIVTLTAQEPGNYRLPPLSLDWWSTAARRWETAMLPAREVVILPAQPTDPGFPSGFKEPWRQSARPAVPETTPEVPAADLEAPLSGPVESNGLGFWTWIAIALGSGWILTMAAWWRASRKTSPPDSVSDTPGPPAASTAVHPLQDEIDAVRAAYESGNAGAAREALLAWAARALPEETPSNLARLARRCREPLRSRILLLEEAFFSPEPVAWAKQPVWEQLPGFVPAPQEEPASFRRGKLIRRRAPNPDAE